jgi:apolipoprotein N-acyltransferase
MAHMSNFVSLIGNPNKPTVIPIKEPLYITISLGIFFFIYLKFLIGSKTYREIKMVTWGVVFGTTTLLSSIWLVLNFIKYCNNLWTNQLVLGATIFINLALTVLAVLMFKRERNN